MESLPTESVEDLLTAIALVSSVGALCLEMPWLAAQEANIRTRRLAGAADVSILVGIGIGPEASLIEVASLLVIQILTAPERVQACAVLEIDSAGGSTAPEASAKGLALLLPVAVLLVQLVVHLVDLLLQLEVAESNRGTQSGRRAPTVSRCARDQDRVHLFLDRVKHPIEILDHCVIAEFDRKELVLEVEQPIGDGG